MTIEEFTKLDVSGMTFRLVDANRNGYMTCPHVIFEGDKNAIRQRFSGDVVGFEGVSKRTMIIYVKEKEAMKQNEI